MDHLFKKTLSLDQAQSEQDPSQPQSDEDPSQPQPEVVNKRKAPRDSHFKVTRVRETNKTFTLRMAKPSGLQSEVGAAVKYPIVCLKEESPGDKHAFHIMHDLNHRNILSMKVVCENRLHKNGTVATFVEPFHGKLREIFPSCLECADNIKHIPSPKLQSTFRQIVIGLDFLRKNGLYHGNLSWDSTLYHGNTVKLAGFKSKEPMGKEEAQWDDWSYFLKMLETVSFKAAIENETLSEEDRFFCGNLDSLIHMLKTIDRTSSLTAIKDNILDHVFFWDFTRVRKFFVNKVSLKLGDARFMQRVSNSSIRGKSWDIDCTPSFKLLVDKMNTYREARRKKSCKVKIGEADEDENKGSYKGDSLKDYVRLICGAFTHWNELKMDIYGIIRRNHPTICTDIKNMLESSDSEDLSKPTNPSDGYGPHGHPPQGHGAARPPSPQNYTKSRGSPRGSMGLDQRHPPLRPSYQGGGSAYYQPGSQQYSTQPASYYPGPGNYGSGQYEAPNYGQPSYLQVNYGSGYGFPASYAVPTMPPQQGHPQQPYPHGYPQASYTYQAPNPAYAFGTVVGPPYAQPYRHQSTQQGWQAAPPYGYSQQSTQQGGQAAPPYGYSQQSTQQGGQAAPHYGPGAPAAPGDPQQGRPQGGNGP